MTTKAWTSSYVAPATPEMPLSNWANLTQMFQEAAGKYARLPAFSISLPNGMNGRLTYAQLDAESNTFAAYLRNELKLAAGDRVALQMPNCLTFPVAAIGVLKAGCVLVNTNPLFTAPEMEFQFKDSGAKVLIILDLFTKNLEDILAKTSIERVVVCKITEYMPSAVAGLVRLVQRAWERSIPKMNFPHAQFSTLMSKSRKQFGASAEASVLSWSKDLTFESLAALQYTGGTTGVAKAAMLTHGNLVSNTIQCQSFMQADMRPGKEVALGALPLYHIFAFTLHILYFQVLGAHSVLVPSPRPLSNLKRTFENYKITWASGVNTLFNGLTQELWFRDSPPKYLRSSAAGGMALQEIVAQRWQEITGTPIVEGYGLTETSPVLTLNPIGGKSRPGSIGIPLPGTDIRLVSEEGHDVAPGDAGELLAKGPQVMKAYWNRPDETQKVMREGWFATGDIATMDADGYFKIVDRKKDMILVSGFNVYPNEIEDCIARHPGVSEVAVVGAPDGASGEMVKAFIIKKDPSLNVDSIREHCRKFLTPYKVPKLVEFRQELPKSNIGKILRKDLRGPRNG